MADKKDYERIEHRKVVYHLDFGNIADVGITRRRSQEAFDRAVSEAVRRELQRTRRI